MNDYIPHKDDEFAFWHNRFLTTLGPLATALGVTPDELTAIAADNTAVNDTLDDAAIKDAAAQEATQAKDDAVSAAKMRARTIAQRIKKTAAFTPEIGEALGINAPATTSGGSDDAKPTAKAIASGNGANLRCDHDHGYADSVVVYRRRGSETAYTRLENVTRFPWHDGSPPLVTGQPEERDYRFRYARGGVEYGQMSDIATVLCGG